MNIRLAEQVEIHRTTPSHEQMVHLFCSAISSSFSEFLMANRDVKHLFVSEPARTGTTPWEASHWIDVLVLGRKLASNILVHILHALPEVSEGADGTTLVCLSGGKILTSAFEAFKVR